MADGPQQLTGNRLDELDGRPVVVVFAEWLASDLLQLLGVDLVRQTDGVHADSGVLGRQSFGGCRLAVVGLSVGDDDADVVDVQPVAVERREDDGSHSVNS